MVLLSNTKNGAVAEDTKDNASEDKKKSAAAEDNITLPRMRSTMGSLSGSLAHGPTIDTSSKMNDENPSVVLTEARAMLERVKGLANGEYAFLQRVLSDEFMQTSRADASSVNNLLDDWESESLRHIDSCEELGFSSETQSFLNQFTSRATPRTATRKKKKAAALWKAAASRAILIAKLAAGSKKVGEVKDIEKCNALLAIIAKAEAKSSWGLDVFALGDVCGAPLALVGHQLIEVRLQLCAGEDKVEGLNARTLQAFLREVEKG